METNELITYSSGSCLCQCERKFELSYEQGLKLNREDMGARWIGSMMHEGLEVYIREGLDAALTLINKIEEDTPALGDDTYKVTEGAAKARAMVRAVALKWPDRNFDMVEQVVEKDIVNPETGGVSRSFAYKGKVDGVVGGAIIDWKSTADPAKYIMHRTIGYQLELYALALAETMEVNISSVQFRLIKTPQIRLSQIPVLDADGLKIVVDADGARVLKANGAPRESGDTALGYVLTKEYESGAAFEARCFTLLTEEPGYLIDEDRFLNDARLLEAEKWLWAVSKRILDNRKTGFWMRNEHACHNFNRACDYLPICEIACSGGDVSVIMETDYHRVESGHVELPVAAVAA